LAQAEVLYGIEILPDGKRRSALAAAIDRVFENQFRGRILPFDEMPPVYTRKSSPPEMRPAGRSRSLAL
jgi:hypothetical protein